MSENILEKSKALIIRENLNNHDFHFNESEPREIISFINGEIKTSREECIEKDITIALTFNKLFIKDIKRNKNSNKSFTIITNRGSFNLDLINALHKRMNKKKGLRSLEEYKSLTGRLLEHSSITLDENNIYIEGFNNLKKITLNLFQDIFEFIDFKGKLKTTVLKVVEDFNEDIIYNNKRDSLIYTSFNLSINKDRLLTEIDKEQVVNEFKNVYGLENIKEETHVNELNLFIDIFNLMQIFRIKNRIYQKSKINVDKIENRKFEDYYIKVYLFKKEEGNSKED